jgi:hypothetical protein
MSNIYLAVEVRKYEVWCYPLGRHCAVMKDVWIKGYGNTGIDSICEVATVQKSNLLKYY